MKKILFILIAAVAFALPAAAQSKTVTDFYLALPANLYNFRQLKNKADLMKYRKKLIKTEDIRNGYLRIESQEFEGWGELALFKKKDGSYILGDTRIDCGPVCGGDLDFWSFKAGKWANVTKQVFPFSNDDIEKILIGKNIPQDDRAYYFELPRQGRTIIAKCDTCEINGSTTIAEFEWNGAKFVKK